MNLIERYGYERAKRELELMDDRSVAMISADLNYRESVRVELLEYRREHRIFEVGDKIVCESFEGLVCVVDLFEDRLVIDTGIKTTPDSKNTMAMALPSDMFRHANPAEIQAGKRLD